MEGVLRALWGVGTRQSPRPSYFQVTFTLNLNIIVKLID